MHSPAMLVQGEASSAVAVLWVGLEMAVQVRPVLTFCGGPQANEYLNECLLYTRTASLIALPATLNEQYLLLVVLPS